MRAGASPALRFSTGREIPLPLTKKCWGSRWGTLFSRSLRMSEQGVSLRVSFKRHFHEAGVAQVMTARACLNRLHRSTVTISTRVVAAHQPRISGESSESTATNVFQKILLTFVEIGREYARFIERSRLPLPSTIVTNLGRLFRHR